MLDVQTLARLRQRNALANIPQCLGLRQALGHHRVQHTTLFHGGLQQLLELHSGMGQGRMVGVFQHHTIRSFLIKRNPLQGEMLDHQAQCKLAHHFKTCEARIQKTVGQAQQSHGGLQ